MLLGIENYSLRFLEQACWEFRYILKMMLMLLCLQKKQKYPNAIYLSLNHTLGGAFCIRWKAVSRAKPESRRVWSYDTGSRWKKDVIVVNQDVQMHIVREAY